MIKAIFKPAMFAMLCCIVCFSSCLKDTATKTYTVFAPVYISKTDARNGVKSDAAKAVVTPGKIFVLGNYIFLNEVDKGIHVIDNTNPSSPINKYFIPIPGNIDLAVKGTTLYADMYRDLLVIDIGNPNAIQIKKVIENVFPARVYNNGFVGDSNRVISGWIKKDTTVDINDNGWGYLFYAENSSSGGNPSPSSLGVPVGIAGSMSRFSLVNNFLYAVTNMELNVIDVSQPQNPVFSNMVQVGWRIETIYPFQDKLFIGSQTGMFIYSITDPAHPSYLSQFSHLTSCDPVIAAGDFAYVTLRTGNNCAGNINRLDILNVQNVQLPVLVKSYPLANPHGLSKSGNHLFICDGDGGLKVFDATDANNLLLLQTISGIKAYDIIATNNNAIVVATDGLYQYDYTNPAHLVLRSKIGL